MERHGHGKDVDPETRNIEGENLFRIPGPDEEIGCPDTQLDHKKQDDGLGFDTEEPEIVKEKE